MYSFYLTTKDTSSLNTILTQTSVKGTYQKYKYSFNTLGKGRLFILHIKFTEEIFER